MHCAVSEQHEWLSAVLRGHFAYYGLPSNIRSMASFALEVRKLWYRVLTRRSQNHSMTWARFNRLLAIFPLPRPTITRA
jgi:RNA-directed DNA polymerase